ncbi:tyrosine-type recombinase/integrase [Lonepinella sp. MS14435]|uniref:tyrosine-type recombinase/integrase n=1 Tax=Lonepinella sp. MS14435 TaxID=3003618 RepID=UPI0036D9EB0F
MARLTKPLTNTEVINTKPKDKNYKLSDGGGLFLLIKNNGVKNWRMRYKRPITKKENEVSLGNFPEVSLQQARKQRDEFLALLAENIDPLEYRKEQELAEIRKAENTFKIICSKWFNDVYPSKASNPDTIAKNWQRLEKHVLPFIGDLPLADIKPRILLELYQKIGAGNTLDKLHRLIKSTMDYGIKLGVIEFHNCNIAKDDFITPIAKNHPSIMPYELPKLIDLMNNAYTAHRIEPNTFYAFNLSLLTGLRQGEVTKLEWRFIDNELLIVPSYVLKQTRKLKEQPRDHIIPLSTQAKRQLETIKQINGTSAFIFAKVRNRTAPMSRESVAKALKEILQGTDLQGRQNAHGLRSIFRTYLTQIGVDVVVAELALAHLSTGKGKIQAIYDRYEYLDERKQALQQWGDYCEQCGMITG